MLCSTVDAIVVNPLLTKRSAPKERAKSAIHLPRISPSSVQGQRHDYGNQGYERIWKGYEEGHRKCDSEIDSDPHQLVAKEALGFFVQCLLI